MAGVGARTARALYVWFPSVVASGTVLADERRATVLPCMWSSAVISARGSSLHHITSSPELRARSLPSSNLGWRRGGRAMVVVVVVVEGGSGGLVAVATVEVAGSNAFRTTNQAELAGSGARHARGCERLAPPLLWAGRRVPP